MSSRALVVFVVFRLCCWSASHSLLSCYLFLLYCFFLLFQYAVPFWLQTFFSNTFKRVFSNTLFSFRNLLQSRLCDNTFKSSIHVKFKRNLNINLHNHTFATAYLLHLVENENQSTNFDDRPCKTKTTRLIHQKWYCFPSCCIVPVYIQLCII